MSVSVEVPVESTAGSTVGSTAEATFSIVARCPRTGAFGAAVASRIPAVGAVVPHLRTGVGGIVTQARTNVYIGLRGIDLLAGGASAEDVVDAVLRWDPEVHLRQFAVVDGAGRVAAFTGDRSEPYAGHRLEDGFAVVGNMLASGDVLDAMAKRFGEQPEAPLTERLLDALAAGQAAGGDKRGKQSAAVRVVEEEEYPLVDLRVDEHDDPIVELRRVYTVCLTGLFPYARTRPTRAALRLATGRDGP
ncbi:MAG: DUF1028 domain-containing protein [Trueperaceae bacterium]